MLKIYLYINEISLGFGPYFLRLSDCTGKRCKLRLGPEVIKLFSCTTQLCMRFQLLIKIKIQTNEEDSFFKLSDVVFIMLINVKMPTMLAF